MQAGPPQPPPPPQRASNTARGGLACSCFGTCVGVIFVIVGLGILIADNTRGDDIGTFNAAAAAYNATDFGRLLDTNGTVSSAPASGSPAAPAPNPLRHELVRVDVRGNTDGVRPNVDSMVLRAAQDVNITNRDVTVALVVPTGTAGGVHAFSLTLPGQPLRTVSRPVTCPSNHTSSSCTDSFMRSQCTATWGGCGTYERNTRVQCRRGSTCGTCHEFRQKTSICAQLSWVRSPSSGTSRWMLANRSCHYDRTTRSFRDPDGCPGLDSRTGIYNRALTVPLTLRSSTDPYLTLMSLTGGSGNFGWTEEEQSAAGNAVLIIGIIIIAAGLGAAWFVKTRYIDPGTKRGPPHPEPQAQPLLVQPQPQDPFSPPPPGGPMHQPVYNPAQPQPPGGYAPPPPPGGPGYPVPPPPGPVQQPVYNPVPMATTPAAPIGYDPSSPQQPLPYPVQPAAAGPTTYLAAAPDAPGKPDGPDNRPMIVVDKEWNRDDAPIPTPVPASDPVRQPLAEGPKAAPPPAGVPGHPGPGPATPDARPITESHAAFFAATAQPVPTPSPAPAATPPTEPRRQKSPVPVAPARVSPPPAKRMESPPRRVVTPPRIPSPVKRPATPPAEQPAAAPPAPEARVRSDTIRSRAPPVPKESAVRLIHVSGNIREIKQVEVPPLAASLNEDDAFILDTPAAIYAFQGTACSAGERAASARLAAELEAERPTADMMVVGTANAPDAFWEALGGRPGAAPAAASRAAPVGAKPSLPRLLHVSGSIRGTHEMEVPLRASSLNEHDAFILETLTHVWVYQGKACSPGERATSARIAAELEANRPTTDMKVVDSSNAPDAFWSVLGGRP